MKIGDKVRVTKCDKCPKVVGKFATIVKMDVVGEAAVKFGRGRPQLNRPTIFVIDHLELVKEDSKTPVVEEVDNAISAESQLDG